MSAMLFGAHYSSDKQMAIFRYLADESESKWAANLKLSKTEKAVLDQSNIRLYPDPLKENIDYPKSVIEDVAMADGYLGALKKHK